MATPVRFNEGQHNRQDDGKFAPKSASESGGTDALDYDPSADPVDNAKRNLGGAWRDQRGIYKPVELPDDPMAIDDDWSQGWASTAPHGEGPSEWGIYRTKGGEIIRAYRKSQKVRFFDSAGEEHGPEQANVAPALAWAHHHSMLGVDDRNPSLETIFEDARR